MTLNVDLSSEVPIYQQLRDRIVEAIAEGALTQGSSLPGIRALAADFGINLHTADEAYDLLRRQDLIRLNRKTGAVVTPTLAGSPFRAMDREGADCTGRGRRQVLTARCSGPVGLCSIRSISRSRRTGEALPPAFAGAGHLQRLLRPGQPRDPGREGGMERPGAARAGCDDRYGDAGSIAAEVDRDGRFMTAADDRATDPGRRRPPFWWLAATSTPRLDRQTAGADVHHMVTSSTDELLTNGVEPAVEVEHLRVIRGKRPALYDFSVRIGRGTITGLLGPSGCGKTTLMRCIVGTQIVASGSVTVLGRLAGTAALRHRVGYMPQDPTIYNDLRVVDNVRYFATLSGVGARAADEVIRAVDLADQRESYCGNLSGGQRARVSLACALVGRPDLLVLDEPTVGLDPVLRADLWEQFDALARGGTTLLVSSHVMDEADHCGDLLLMRDGHLVAHTTPARLRKDTGCTSLEEAFLSIIRRTTVPAAG